MNCVICSQPVEPWPGGGGFGNNPDPWPQGDTPEELFRCCRWCNEHIVLPLRLRRAGMMSS